MFVTRTPLAHTIIRGRRDLCKLLMTTVFKSTKINRIYGFKNGVVAQINFTATLIRPSSLII